MPDNRFARLYIVAFPLLLLLYYGIITYTDRYCMLSLYRELGFIQNVTIVLLLLSAGISLWNAYRWRQQAGTRHYFFIAFGLLFILAGLEEASWGQRFFGFESPDVFVEYNAQEETNLHNFLEAEWMSLLYVGTMIYGLLPLAANWRPIAALRERRWLEVPSPLLVPLLVISSVISLRLAIDADNIVTFTYSEAAELAYVLGLLISMLIHWHRLGEPSPRSPRLTSARWTAVALLGTVGMFGGAVGSTWQHCHYAENRAVGRQVAALASEDDAIIFVGEAQDARIFLRAKNRTGDNFFVLPDDDTPATLDRILREHRHLFVVIFRDRDSLIERTLIDQTYPITTNWYLNAQVLQFASRSIREPETVDDVRFGEHITLTGASPDPAGPLAAGDAFGVALHWQTDAPLDIPYKVFVHLYDGGGGLIAQHDGVPGTETRPTTAWPPGEVVLDRHGLLIPADTPPGTYTLGVGMYDPATGERLPVTLADGEAAEVFILASLLIE